MRTLKFFLIWINLLAFGIIFSSTAALAESSAAYDAHGRRDPFMPLVSGHAPEASGLMGVESIDDAVIEGVVYDPRSTSVAIINGTLVKEGETVGSVTVVKVRSDGAVLSVNGSEAFKPMFSNDPNTKQVS